MTNTKALDPKRTALLVLDYQPAILGSLVDADSLLARTSEAIKVVRRNGARVGYVRVGFDDADYASVPPHSRMAPVVAAVGKALHADAPATAVHAHVAPEPGDIVVRKTRIGAFSTTDLDDRLRAQGIIQIILAGLTTSGVVLSTVRDAHDRDYQVFVLADAMADHDPDVHEFLVEKIFPQQASVITTEELAGLFSAAGKEVSFGE